MKKTIEEIRNLHPAVRVAGYIVRNAAITECGAKLRTIKEDEEWSKEEEEEYENACAESEPWFYALTDDERNFLRWSGIENVLGKLCRGEELPTG